jgi:serine/threonine protein kinase/Leucine-rich repeat (LRR) protein
MLADSGSVSRAVKRKSVNSPSPASSPRDLFLEALEKPAPSERSAFLDGACRGDAALRSAVEELLANHRDDSFLEAPAITSPTVTGAPAEQPGERIGHYKLLQRIGEGGFGIVWMAEQEQPVRRRVALKIIKMGMDTREVIARFEQERQALAMMDHPNIARVFDAGATQSGRPFFVMELVRGVKITEYCDEQQLPNEQRLALFIRVCQAVQHAHQKGIIHRDLKPSNILVTINDGEPVPKVIDFGVAKATQGRLTDATLFTQFEQMVGTPLYMSPEQAELTSLDIDTRSDIYSLGVLLYELLTGHTPIDTTTMAQAGMDEIRRIIREVDPPRPSARVKTLAGNELTTAAKRRHTDAAKLPSALRGDLDWIVMKCLEKDRKRRYDTANGLALDLQRHLANEIVTARPPTATYLLGKLVRRNKLAVTAGAAIAASLVIGIAASVWQAVRAEREAKRAKAAESQAVATLDELRSTAPAFAAQARSLAGRERFAEAIEKLDYAIKLRPDVVDYLLAKADLLQSQLQFSKAATAYRAALSLKPDHARAQANAALCDKLQTELDAGAKLSRESLMQFFLAMVAENRSAAELLTVGRMVGEEKKLILDYWVERLKSLPLPPVMPIEKRLSLLVDGTLALNLTKSIIDDLTPLEGMPLSSLNLSACPKVADLRPLSGLPLRSLNLDGTKITDLAPLANMRTLKELDVSGTEVRDLSPLSGLPLAQLLLDSSKVVDLTPLRGLPLRFLSLRDTVVSDIQPLAGMPLATLDCTAIPTADFSVLSGAPLKSLFLQGTRVGDLSFLHRMPLETLALNNCALARGYKVLAELKSLKVLLLTERLWNLPSEELVALAALRQHPALRQIEIGVAIPNINTTGSAAEFWKKWDRDMACVLALHRAGVKFSTDWRKDGGLSITIEDPPFKDLAVFHGSNLASLSLDGTSVSDLTPLVGLPLKHLYLKRTPVTDLSPLAGLALEELRVKELHVTDISVLSRAPLCDSLTTLFLEYLKVTDFSPVAACKTLKIFSAFHSPMTDLAPLRGLPLENLYISGAQVRDLSLLADMPLEEIFFDLTPVTDITPLHNIPTLKYVILPEKAEDIEALKKLPNLQRLSFHYDPKVKGPSKTAAEFWNTWDGDVPCVVALRQAGVKFSTDLREDGSLSITIEDPGFKDLAVFRGANLASLTLTGTSVSDLTPLAGLPLKNLQLRRNPVTDLSPLAGCALEELRVKEMPVTDISVLSRAPLCDSLTTLWLEELKVSDISSLAACKALTVFSALSSSIADLTPLRGLRLKTLIVAHTEVHDLSAIAGMPLEELLFDFTPVTSIAPLQNISSLKRVMLSENVENVETLRKLPNLERLSFFWDAKARVPSMTAAQFWKSFQAHNSWVSPLRDAGIKVKALKPLEDGTFEVNLEGSTIKDLTVLSGAPISILRLGGTAVSDLSPLRGMPLRKLYLQNTMVTDLSPLKGMQLESLHVSGTKVIDLSPLKGMRLESLNVSGTTVADLSVLRGMPFFHVRLHQCPNIVDLSPLKNSTTLQRITLPAQAKDFEFLRTFPKLELLSFTEDSTTQFPDRTAAKFWEEYDAKKR